MYAFERKLNATIVGNTCEFAISHLENQNRVTSLEVRLVISTSKQSVYMTISFGREFHSLYILVKNSGFVPQKCAHFYPFRSRGSGEQPDESHRI